MKELEDKLREIIASLCNDVEPGQIELGTDLFSELGLDSMNALEIVLELEELFDVSVEESALEHIRTLEDFLKAAKSAMLD